MESATTHLAVNRQLVDDVCERLSIRSLVLFGSWASGSPPPTEESDVDLAITLAGSGPRLSHFDYLEELGQAFPQKLIDLVFLSDADPLFRWEIMREGVLLWGDPMEFLEWRAFAFRDFVDSADLRALERILFEKKMRFIRQRLNAAA